MTVAKFLSLLYAVCFKDRKKVLWKAFLSSAANIRKGIALFEVSLTYSARPSVKNSTKMNMSPEYWWNYTDKRKPKAWTNVFIIWDN